MWCSFCFNNDCIGKNFVHHFDKYISIYMGSSVWLWTYAALRMREFQIPFLKNTRARDSRMLESETGILESWNPELFPTILESGILISICHCYHYCILHLSLTSMIYLYMKQGNNSTMDDSFGSLKTIKIAVQGLYQDNITISFRYTTLKIISHLLQCPSHFPPVKVNTT